MPPSIVVGFETDPSSAFMREVVSDTGTLHSRRPFSAHSAKESVLGVASGDLWLVIALLHAKMELKSERLKWAELSRFPYLRKNTKGSNGGN